MSRTLSSIISSAIASDATRPIYLIEMGFSSAVRAATWDQSISWNGYTWAASGVQVKGLGANGTQLILPTGTSDPWLSLVLNEGTRDKTISIYEHHQAVAASELYDVSGSPLEFVGGDGFGVVGTQEDAVLLFTGIMDEATITDKITVKVLDASRAKAFPAVSADQPAFTHLMTSGDTIIWGNTTITVN